MYQQYVDEDGDWRRRYSKIVFSGEDQVGHPKIIGQIESHPLSSVVQQKWEDQEDYEVDKTEKVEELLEPT